MARQTQARQDTGNHQSAEKQAAMMGGLPLA